MQLSWGRPIGRPFVFSNADKPGSFGVLSLLEHLEGHSSILVLFVYKQFLQSVLEFRRALSHVPSCWAGVFLQCLGWLFQTQPGLANYRPNGQSYCSRQGGWILGTEPKVLHRYTRYISSSEYGQIGAAHQAGSLPRKVDDHPPRAQKNLLRRIWAFSQAAGDFSVDRGFCWGDAGSKGLELRGKYAFAHSAAAGVARDIFWSMNINGLNLKHQNRVAPFRWIFRWMLFRTAPENKEVPGH